MGEKTRLSGFATNDLLEHPLTAARRAWIARHRTLGRRIGFGRAGRLISLLNRFGIVEQEQKSYYVLSTQPPIIYLGNIMRHTFEIAELMRDRPTSFIKNSYHTFERMDRLATLADEYRQFRQFYPQHTLVFVCPTESEYAAFQNAGIESSVFFNKNALVDERQYRIVPGVAKIFDAIHNGQLAPYKRHELAENVSNLAVIVYLHSKVGGAREKEEYGQHIRERLKHAVWLNDVGTFIRPDQISTFLCRAHVGLCLSSEEGPMAASMEYLLSGLGVVSTRSLGGREVFFNDQFCEIVDDSSEAVACGVKEVISRMINPEAVRSQTLSAVRSHRKTFVDLVNRLLVEREFPPTFEETFDRIFVNKLRAAAPFPGAFMQHVVKGMPVELCRTMAACANQ